MRAVRASVVAVVLLCTAGSGVAAADTAPRVTDGWWWSVQPDPAILPAPPTVPPDGLRVSSDAVGEESVSAVRVEPAAGLRAVRLTLHVSDQRGLAAGALRAQLLTATFDDGTRAGSWPKRPQAPAAAPVLTTQVDLTAGTVAVDLTTAPAAAVGVLLSATPGADGQPRDLDVAFDAVRPQDVTTAAAPAAAPAAPAPSGQDGFVPAGGPASTAPAPAAPPVLAGSAPQPAALAPATAPVQAPVAAAPPAVAPRTLPVAVTRPDPPRRRVGLAFLAVLAALVVAQQGGARRPRLSLHGRPDPGAAPAAAAPAGRRPRPPRLR